jgi:amino acid transporter
MQPDPAPADPVSPHGLPEPSGDGARLPAPVGLRRHFGLFQAVALNVTMIVGAGVFLTVPLMLQEVPGPYALLGWLAAGALMLVDGLIWSELGATLPGSGGSYLYLLECYGRQRWGRLMAFLFIWQFLISGPLEVASGLIAVSQFSNALDPRLARFDRDWTYRWAPASPPAVQPAEGGAPSPFGELAVSIGPSRIACVLIGVGLLALLYRRITSLGRLTVTFWLGVMAVVAWILLEGGLRFDPAAAFDFRGAASFPRGPKLGALMILAMYSYLGYYNVCYIGDEVRDPGRTIPRAILLSALLVCLLFAGLHLAMLGTVPWGEVLKSPAAQDNLPAEFMRRIHGDGAAVLVTLLLIWSCTGSVFAALLGYSRIPYGAARYGHFFAGLGRVHPVHHIPHVSLLLVGGLTLFWSFFDLASVINALITTRILEQFIGQAVGVVLLRRRQPDRPRPYRMWLYPLPCGLAVVGWLYMYLSAGSPFILLGLGTLAAGGVAFLLWARRTGGWPFAGASL